jgi:hypothetical protein
MKKRRPKPRKQFRQPPKRLPPTSTDKPPPLDWQTPLAEPTLIRGTPNPALGTSGIVQPPLPVREAAAVIQAEDGTLRADATVGRAAQHKEMLARITVLESLMAKLPKQSVGIGHNQPLITQEDIQEIKQAIAILKAQPVVPTAPDQAKAAGSILMKYGERIGTWVLKQADLFVSEAVKETAKRLVQLLALSNALMLVGQAVEAWLR